MLQLDLRSPEPAKQVYAQEFARELPEGRKSAWLVAVPMVTTSPDGSAPVYWALLQIRCPTPGTVAVEIPIALGFLGIQFIGMIKRNPKVSFVLPGGICADLPLHQWTLGLDRTAESGQLHASGILSESRSQDNQIVTP